MHKIAENAWRTLRFRMDYSTLILASLINFPYLAESTRSRFRAPPSICTEATFI